MTVENAAAVEVTPHAVDRYLERIDPAADRAGAVAALRAALRGARRLHAQGAEREVYAVDGDAYRIVVRRSRGRAPALLTVLFAPTRDGTGAPLPALDAPPTPPAVTPADLALPAVARAAAFNARQDAHAAALRVALEARYQRAVDAARADADEAGVHLRAAWVLLLRCAPHVSRDLCEEIVATVPAAWAARRPPASRDG